jgi:heat shock protein 5
LGLCLEFYRGTPQIEVTFEVNINRILNVRAEDKGTGKSEAITITSNTGCLTQEEIDTMVQEAHARNSLEKYVYGLKDLINDRDKLAGLLESDEKEKIEYAVKDALEWLYNNQNVEKRGLPKES